MTRREINRMKKLIIEKDKLRSNINIIKNMTQSKIIAVLKGNGYGLGMIDFAQVLHENGIDFFAVSDIGDAVKLSEYLNENNLAGKVLLLVPATCKDEALLVIKKGIIPSVGSTAAASVLNEAAAELNTEVDFHLKIDTGFGRFGFLPADIPGVCDFLKTLQNIRISGTYSHFSFSFSKKEKDVYVQFKIFKGCVDLIREKGLDPGMLHICNSCAFLRFPAMHLDAVRIGSAFLGRIPVENTYGLQKIGFLKSEIIEIKELPPNHNIGYANTYRTRRQTRIGIVPVGYLDGFGVEKSRDVFRPIDVLRYLYNDITSFNKRLYVKVGQKPAPILGRISTFNIIVDLTGIDANTGDEVILDINPMFAGSHIERNYI